jgi:hypothetical protein
LLRGAVKAAQHFYGVRNGFGSEKAGAEYSFAEPGNLAVLVNGAQPAARKAGNFQPDRIRTDVYRGERGHEIRPTVYMPQYRPVTPGVKTARAPSWLRQLIAK